jgi:hypothetical protein
MCIFFFSKVSILTIMVNSVHYCPAVLKLYGYYHLLKPLDIFLRYVEEGAGS